MNKIPKHVAIIMDGNGRWANLQGKNRVSGHQQGAKSVREVVEEAVKMKLEYLTLYAFSTDNWSRPKEEVSLLMKLLVNSLKNEFRRLIKNNIRLQSIGLMDGLPAPVKDELCYVIEKTKNNTGMVLTLALNYGGKEELTAAVKAIAFKVKNSIISPEKVDQSTIIEHLYTQNLPAVDLLIRTSGEERISNFLLWHIAYAELYFTKTLWPDFKKEDLKKHLWTTLNEKEDLEKRANNSHLKSYYSYFLIGLFLLLGYTNYAQTEGFVKGRTYVVDSIKVSGLKSFNAQTVISYSGLRKGQKSVCRENKSAKSSTNYGA
jgi:undecaprenyl diphosphate synthase